jgi:GNAT superfamily N-acetyltransferase
LTAVIRRYRDSDRAAVYDVCVETADAGRSTRGRYRTEYQPPPGPPETQEEQRLDAMFHPERRLRPELAPHPAHLHINLLAGYRGAGHGRELISTFLASVAAAGAASCHLGVHPANVAARRFYARVGFRPVEVPGVEPGTYLVRPAS